MLRCDLGDSIESIGVEPGARGIVRVADDDEFGPPRNQTLERLDIDLPAPFIHDEPPLFDVRTERARQPPCLHVIRDHHRDLVVRLDEIPRREVVRFRTAVRDLHVIGRCARIDAGDELAQRDRAVRLRVAQRLCQERLARSRIVGELAEQKRMHAAFGQVELHLVFVGGLHALHRELFESHGASLYTEHHGEAAACVFLGLQYRGHD